MPSQKVFRLVLLGSGGVGMTTMTGQFVFHEFRDTYDPTIEENYNRDVDIDGEQHRVEVFDDADQVLAQTCH